MGVLIVFAPVLIGGKTLSTASYTLGTNGFDPFPGQDPVGQADPYRLDVSAQALAFEPWAEVTAREWRDGTVPLWNPYQGSGAPLAANMQSSVFDPLNLAVNLHPTPRTWDLTLISSFLLGAICTYALCRVIGMGYLAAVAGGTAYSLSGYFSLYSNVGFVRTYLYLPLLCLLIEWVMRSSRFLPIPLLGLGVFGCIVVGMPEIAFFVLLLAGTYALYRTATGPRARSRWRTVGAWVGAFAFGLALAAPLLALFVQFESLSFNVHKGESGVGSKVDPGRFLLNWLAPFFNGAPLDAISPAGVMSGTRNWVGGAVFVLVLAGLASRTRAARLVVPFFGVVGAVMLAKAYGLPALDWIGRLPVIERVDLPTFGLPVVGFAAALVGAAGVDGIRRGEVRRTWFVGGLAVAALGLFLVLLANRMTLRGIPGDRAIRDIGLAAGTACVVVVVVLAVRARPAAYAVTALVLVELVFLAPNPFAERADPYRPPEWLTVLRGELADRPYERVFGIDAQLYPNTAGGHGLYDIRMLDALYSDRYYRYVRTFIDPLVYDRFVGGRWGSAEGNPAYRHNQMFDLLGVRYIVSKQPDEVAALAELLPPGSGSDLLNVHAVTVGGDSRPAIFQHAANETALLLPTPFAGRVQFDYGVDDALLEDPVADGVDFSMIATRQSGARDVVWQGTYAPGDPADPRGTGWRSGVVDIPAAADPVVQLSIRTDARGNLSTDWAAWSRIQAEEARSTAEPAAEGLEPVAELDGTYIYQNPSPAPRAFVVHDVDVVPDIDAAEDAFAASSDRFGNGALRVGFDATERAIVEAEPDEIPASLRDGPSCTAGGEEARITTYEADRVTLEVNTPCAGLLVLSDTYFPGWQATVNGNAAEIHPTDLALRGVVVEAGRSEVVFRYRPSNFRTGVVVALLGVVAMAGAGVYVRLARRRTVAQAESG